jgi:coenzyme Q-binding protein COQ10
MPTFRTSRRVRHSAAHMFDLVADVERYPEFLPLCEGLKVRRRTPDEDGREVLVADMTVGYRAIHETFTSRVTLDRASSKILVEYINGPFRQLENRWTFRDEEDGGSTVEFFIAYEFRSRTLGLLMGAMFDKAFRKFAEAFEERANRIYGLTPRLA